MTISRSRSLASLALVACALLTPTLAPTHAAAQTVVTFTNNVHHNPLHAAAAHHPQQHKPSARAAHGPQANPLTAYTLSSTAYADRRFGAAVRNAGRASHNVTYIHEYAKSPATCYTPITHKPFYHDRYRRLPHKTYIHRNRHDRSNVSFAISIGSGGYHAPHAYTPASYASVHKPIHRYAYHTPRHHIYTPTRIHHGSRHSAHYATHRSAYSHRSSYHHRPTYTHHSHRLKGPGRVTYNRSACR